jgi:hypothetical protein
VWAVTATPTIGCANCYGIESKQTNTTGIFKCDWVAACYSARGILVWDRHDSSGTANVQREPCLVRSIESGERSLRLACLPVGHMREYYRRFRLYRASGSPLDSRSIPAEPVAADNIACPQSPASMPDGLRFLQRIGVELSLTHTTLVSK